LIAGALSGPNLKELFKNFEVVKIFFIFEEKNRAKIIVFHVFSTISLRGVTKGKD